MNYKLLFCKLHLKLFPDSQLDLNWGLMVDVRIFTILFHQINFYSSWTHESGALSCWKIKCSSPKLCQIGNNSSSSILMYFSEFIFPLQNTILVLPFDPNAAQTWPNQYLEFFLKESFLLSLNRTNHICNHQGH